LYEAVDLTGDQIEPNPFERHDDPLTDLRRPHFGKASRQHVLAPVEFLHRSLMGHLVAILGIPFVDL
jgi:hypothetical protein